MPDSKMTSRQIETALVRHFEWWRNLCIPNAYIADGWEADLFVIRPSLWAEEIEIKVSYQDFKREFVKKTYKHEVLIQGIPRYKHGSIHLRVEHYVKAFSFAAPTALAQRILTAAPAHCGVLAIENHSVRVLRAPTKLKVSRKLTEEECRAVMSKTYHKFWRMRLEQPISNQQVRTSAPLTVSSGAFKEEI